MALVSSGYKILSPRNMYGLPKATNIVNSESVVTSSDGENTYREYTVGENVTAGNAIYIHTDGLAYLADNTTHSCDGIAIIDAVLGGETLVAFQNGDVIENTSYDFTIGNPVFLGTGSINCTTEIVNTVGVYRQELGKAVSEIAFSLNIDNTAELIGDLL